MNTDNGTGEYEEKYLQVIEKLQPINYEPFGIAYYVLRNSMDMGNSDFCEKCIADAVKVARKFHKEQRRKILDKFKQISETGCFKIGRKKVNAKAKYTDTEIAKSKRHELKKYPAKSTFSYEGHDPDFGGGLTEPCCCEGCGEPFRCSFTPDKEEAGYLLEYVNSEEVLTDRQKWEIDIALYNYPYVKEDVKPIMDKVIDKILNQTS